MEEKQIEEVKGNKNTYKIFLISLYPFEVRFVCKDRNNSFTVSNCDESFMLYVSKVPISVEEIKKMRIEGLYKRDNDNKIKCSHDNPQIKDIYSKFLGKPLSDKAHEMLHTTYSDKSYLVKRDVLS